MQKMGLGANFWFGHQGWDTWISAASGRRFLFIGLMLWLLLVGRALWPALKTRDDSRSITMLVFLSTVAIGLFYGAGLMWGRNTHLSMVEYWRWWSCTCGSKLLRGLRDGGHRVSCHQARAGTREDSHQRRSVRDGRVPDGRVLGTFHHLYWTGTPTGVLAIGSVFSALEVVRWCWSDSRPTRTTSTASRSLGRGLRWPMLFFVAVRVLEPGRRGPCSDS